MYSQKDRWSTAPSDLPNEGSSCYSVPVSLRIPVRRRLGAKPRRSIIVLLSAIALFLLLPLPGAESQAVRSLSTVEHIRTEAFDIYFPPSLADHGERLASFADEVLADLEGLLDIDAPGGRIPVLLSDAELDMNGYSISYPSNRIVIYLGGAGTDGELVSLGDELRDVFIHELTHAMAANARSPFWSFLAALAGDFIAPVYWIIPKALSEGTAVWVESGAGDRGVGPLEGRLNDPAALEPVYIDIARGKRRGLWEVSGLADHPGSGSLSYLYGALFASFLEERYGEKSLGELWRLASEGNIISGFDGTLLSKGTLERVTGRPPDALWEDFLDWLAAGVGAGARAEAGAEFAGSAGDKGPAAIVGGAAGGRFGAFCADEGSIYYLDLERSAVFALDLRPGAMPRRLFPADAYLEDIGLASDGRSLSIAWVEVGSGGRIIPARYSYDFEDGILRREGSREIEAPAAARTNLDAGSPVPFVHRARQDYSTGQRYGLVRLGSRVFPARISPEGSMEVLESPLLFVRSLALKADSAGENQPGEPPLVLSATLSGSPSRIALLAEEDGIWKLYLQKSAPPGGAAFPVFSGEAVIVYRSELADGRQELVTTTIDRSALDSDFQALEASWVPLERMREALSAGETAGKSAGDRAEPEDGGTRENFERTKPSLFPVLFETSRYPYADAESAGLVFQGADLTERLAWAASAGWDFAARTPEASLALQLAVDEHILSISATDSTESDVWGVGPTRILGAALGYRYTRRLLPLNRRLWTSASGYAAGLTADYSIGDYFPPDFDYASLAGSLAIGYTSQRSLPFAPFDRSGISASGGLDYEYIPGVSSAFSFSGAVSMALPRPAVDLSLYGAFTPSDELLFHPSGRYYSASGTLYPSGLAAPYPEFKEYGAMDGGSPWYGFGEVSARLFNVELHEKIGIVRMPFLPSWTIRRASLIGGLRAAVLESDKEFALPYSAFVRTEIDAALLAGLAAEGHIALSIEASLAFVPSLADGKAFHMDFGFGVTY